MVKSKFKYEAWFLLYTQEYILNLNVNVKQEVKEISLLISGFSPWSRPQVFSFSSSDRNLSSQTSACYQSSQTPDCCLSSPASSCWDPSLQSQAPQNEAYYQFSQIYSHRKYSEPPAYQSSQSLPLTQHEVTEKAASVSHRDRFTPYPQTPERLFEQQSTPWIE